MPTQGDLTNGQDGANDAAQDAAEDAEKAAIKEAERAEELRQYNLFFSTDKLNRFSISITRAEWDRMQQNMADYYTEFNSLRTNEYYKANITYSGPEGDIALEESGIRTRGNIFSRTKPEPEPGNYQRAHFQLHFSQTFDLVADTPEYLARKDRRLFGQRAIALKHSLLFNEVYAYNYLNSLGLRAPKATYAQVVISITEANGSTTEIDFGIYSMIEVINKDFLKRHWGGGIANDGDLYKALWQNGGPASLENLSSVVDGASNNILGVANWETNYRPSYNLVTNTDPPRAHTRLREFTAALATKSGATLKTWLDANFEIQDFIKWMAANLMIGMPDDYRANGNNYYLYFPPEGKGAFIPYDYDNSFGTGWTPYVTANIGIYSVPKLTGRPSHPLVDKVLAIPEYKAAYETYLTEILSTFTFADYEAKHDALGTLVAGKVVTDPIPEPNAVRGNLQADSGLSGYFQARRDKTSLDLGVAVGSIQAIRISGFTDNGNGSYGIGISNFANPPSISVGVDESGIVPSKVKFTLTYTELKQNVSDTLVIEDTTTPFSASFTVRANAADYQLLAEAYNGSNTIYSTSSVSTLGRSYYNDYVSVESVGGGQYKFRFKPGHGAYNTSSAGGVSLRGRFNGVEYWDPGLPMTDTNADGIYESSSITASTGDPYKFTTYTGMTNWFVDYHNAKNENSGDSNSLIP